MLAVAMAIIARQAGWSIYFYTFDAMIRRLAPKATGRFNQQMQACLRPVVPIVDDVATCLWTGPKPTWSSGSSPAVANAAP
jgi:hypothetical protein